MDICYLSFILRFCIENLIVLINDAFLVQKTIKNIFKTINIEEMD